MSTRQSLLFIGIFTAIVPFLGIRSSTKTFLMLIVAVTLIAISYFMKVGGEKHTSSDSQSNGEKRSTSTFVEHNGKHEDSREVITNPQE